MALPIDPPANVVSQGPVAALGGFINMGNNVWFGVYAGVPTGGANWCGPGSVIVDYTNFDIYLNTNTLASPTWTKKVD